MRISDWSSDVCSSDLIGKRQAVVSSTDTSPTALAELVERAVAMARNVPEDPHCGLADNAEIARGIPTPDMFDSTAPSPESIKEQARAFEEAALDAHVVATSDGSAHGRRPPTVHPPAQPATPA